MPVRRPTRALVVAALAALVGGIACYGDFFNGYLGRLISYDDGVYMGAATLFDHGIVPYRDFVFLHPPGVIRPSHALRVDRSLCRNGGGERSGTTVRRVRGNGKCRPVRSGRPDEADPCNGGRACRLHASSRRTHRNQAIYLEPLLIAACLVGTALLFDGEGFATQHGAGGWRAAAFGLACGIKLWGLCPFLALAVVAVISGYRTHAARLALAGAGTFTLLCAPFLVMAPTAFVHDVLVVQASRTDPGSASIISRIGNLLYLPSSLTSRPHPNPLAPQVLTIPQHVIIGVTAGIAITIIIWPFLRTRRQPLTALESYSFASVGLVTAAFMLFGDYYSHYGAFAAVFFGLVASAAVARWISMRKTKTSVSDTRPAGTVLVMAGVVVAVVVLVGYGVHTLRTRTARWTLSSRSLAQIAAAIPPGRCVVTDDVSVLLLSGRFIVDDPGCPRVVDSFAANLALTDGHVGQFEASGAVQRAWLAWLERADVVVSDEPTLSQAAPEDGWGQEVQRYLRVHFVLLKQTETVSIYRRVVGDPRPAELRIDRKFTGRAGRSAGNLIGWRAYR